MQWLVSSLNADSGIVAGRLARVGEIVYCPMMWVRQTTRNGVVHVQRPRYPGYLFVCYSHHWPAIKQVDGVSDVLHWSEGEKTFVHLLPQEFIDDLRQKEQEPPVKDDIEIDFGPGDWVRILAGAWTGCFGEFKERRHGTGKVMVDVFNRTVAVSIPLHQIELAIPSGASAAGTARRASA